MKESAEEGDEAGPEEPRGGPASLAMRRKPAFDDARLDAMAKKLGGREQASRTGPRNQDGRCGRTILTGMQQPEIFSVDGSFIGF